MFNCTYEVSEGDDELAVRMATDYRQLRWERQ